MNRCKITGGKLHKFLMNYAQNNNGYHMSLNLAVHLDIFTQLHSMFLVFTHINTDYCVGRHLLPTSELRERHKSWVLRAVLFNLNLSKNWKHTARATARSGPEILPTCPLPLSR